MRLIALLAATIAGLLFAAHYSLPQLYAFPLVATTLAACLLLRHHPRLFWSTLLLFFFLLSAARYPLLFTVSPRLTSVVDSQQKSLIQGLILQTRQYADGGSSLDLRVDSLGQVRTEQPLLESFSLRLYLQQGGEALLPGDQIRFQSRIRRPRLFGTPGEFNRPRYLAGQGIIATAWLKSADKLRVVGREDFFPQRTLAAGRQQVAEFIQSSLLPQRAELVRALVLGESKLLSDKTRKLLAGGGISHLFAISGLHLGLLALFGYRLLAYVYCRSARLLLWQPPQRVLPLLLLPLLLIYLLFTGDAIATRRAFCLAAAGGALILWRRQVHPLQLLTSLALVFLLLNPLLLWQASWQLSFAGAAGVLLWRPLWQGSGTRLPKVWRFLWQLLLVSMAATLSTLPLVLATFHLLAPVGPLLNLFAVPLVTLLALPVGFLALVLWFVSPGLSLPLFNLSGAVLEFICATVAKVLSAPLLQGINLFLSPWQYTAIALLILPVLLWPMVRRGHRLYGSAALLIGLALLLWNAPRLRSAVPEVIMLSVGQGDAFLLRDSGGKTILIDGGGLYSKRFDVGERLLAPAFGELGVRRLAAVILTHDHPDHRKGLNYILQNVPVDRFISNKSRSELSSSLAEVLTAEKIPFRSLASGWSFLEGWQDGQLQLFVNKPGKNENDRSVVLYWQLGRQGVLLTGDLEAAGVDSLIDSGFPGPVTLLKLPHHGSRHSHTKRLIDRLSPQLCLVSAGYRNYYRLPAQQLVDELSRRQIPLLRSDLQGTVRLSLKGDHWNAEPLFGRLLY